MDFEQAEKASLGWGRRDPLVVHGIRRSLWCRSRQPPVQDETSPAMRLGIPEMLVTMAVIGAMWLVPIAAAVWALLTLHRLDRSQHEIHDRLGAIERLLQR